MSSSLLCSVCSSTVNRCSFGSHPVMRFERSWNIVIERSRNKEQQKTMCYNGKEGNKANEADATCQCITHYMDIYLCIYWANWSETMGRCREIWTITLMWWDGRQPSDELVKVSRNVWGDDTSQQEHIMPSMDNKRFAIWLDTFSLCLVIATRTHQLLVG